MNAKEKTGREEELLDFANDISAAWGDENIRRPVAWPINMRIGKL